MTSLQNLDRKGTYAELGKLLGISRQAVHGLIKRGALPMGGTLLQWLRAYAVHMERHTTAAPADDGRAATLIAAKTRESEAKAHKAEVETAEKLRELVSLAETEAAIRDWSVFGVARMEQAAVEITENLQALGLPVTLDMIRAHLADARRALAPPPLAGSREDDR